MGQYFLMDKKKQGWTRDLIHDFAHLARGPRVSLASEKGQKRGFEFFLNYIEQVVHHPTFNSLSTN